MRKRYEMWAETSKMMPMCLATKRGGQLFSRLTIGGGLYCRDDPVGFGPKKGTG